MLQDAFPSHDLHCLPHIYGFWTHQCVPKMDLLLFMHKSSKEFKFI